MKILRSTDSDFAAQFRALVRRSDTDTASVMPVVAEILGQIKARGDEALREQIERFDRWDGRDLLIDPVQMKRAWDATDQTLKNALQVAYDRICRYHEKQAERSWMSFEETGEILGQKITPVDRAGLYVPGGKAFYPSSLLMNFIPAKVAGVREIIVCTPAVGGELNELLLATLHLLGAPRAYKIGGASAIGAMAYGTQSVPAVDVITGPGNIYVATAKKLVFGEVNIDMVAGPSEIGVLADSSANVHHTAVDLLSQAEHDELASALMVTTDEALAQAVRDEIYAILPSLPREVIARTSIDNKGAIVVARDMDEAVELMNELAVEHLEIVTQAPFDLLPRIRHAGAIFLGHYTPEAMGDYVAGPNHTLPTGGSARFFSPLGVYHFIKRSSIIAMSERSVNELSAAVQALANAEGLTAHAMSVAVRTQK